MDLVETEVSQGDIPAGAVLCDGFDPAEYCDGTGDCNNQPDWCSCDAGIALCTTNGFYGNIPAGTVLCAGFEES